MRLSCRLTTVIVLTLLLLITATGWSVTEAAKPPLFELKDLNGDTYRLADDLGNDLIILDFWATWCKPCMRELPHINKIYEEFKDKGLKVYAISVDDAKSKSKIKPAIKRYKFTFPVLLDPDNKVVRKYSANSTVPFLMIIGKDGNVIREFSGYKSGDEKIVRKIIEEQLAESK